MMLGGRRKAEKESDVACCVGGNSKDILHDACDAELNGGGSLDEAQNSYFCWSVADWAKHKAPTFARVWLIGRSTKLLLLLECG
jgi:hypothetical protein